MDEQGNLQPGDEGYVAPETQIADQALNVVPGDNPPPIFETTPDGTFTIETQPEATQELPVAGIVEPEVDGEPAKVLTSAEAGALNLQGKGFVEPVEATQENYNRLLSAYIALKQRSALDPIIEKQLDTQAGLI